MPDYRRGAAAIEDAASSKGVGSFRPFVPHIEWRDDKEEKYVLFLTPVDQIPTVDLYEWIPVGSGTKNNGDTYTKYEKFISRKDPAIGEATDELMDRLDQYPKSRSLAVAVELEPVIETVGGRKKAVSFTVATDTYNRKDDDGNSVEVVQPLIGIVTQAAQNFFGWLSSYDASEGPIEETAMNVVRRGKDANTTYDFMAKEGCPIDFSPLLDYIDGVSYLNDEMETILSLVEHNDPDEAVKGIAAILIDKRLDELSDKARYDELVGPIEEIKSKYGNKKAGAASAKKEHPARPSRRTAEVPEENAAQPEEGVEVPASKSDRFAKLRAKVEAKNAA